MFLDAVHQVVRNHPDSIAAVIAGEPVTYSTLENEVLSLAAGLAGEGLVAGEPVGLTIADEYRHLVASLALMHIGCIQVTLATHESPGQRIAIAQRTRIVAVLAATESDGVASVRTIVPDVAPVVGETRSLPAMSSQPGLGLPLPHQFGNDRPCEDHPGHAPPALSAVAELSTAGRARRALSPDADRIQQFQAPSALQSRRWRNQYLRRAECRPVRGLCAIRGRRSSACRRSRPGRVSNSPPNAAGACRTRPMSASAAQLRGGVCDGRSSRD